jgi:hypothetical protein
MMNVCQVEGCKKRVSTAGHTLCLDHWKADRGKTLQRCTTCGRPHESAGPLCLACSRKPAGEDDSTEPEAPRGYLSSTRIGKHFGLSNVKMNQLFAKLGWIEKCGDGWAPTERGSALGANVREQRAGIPFVVWPESTINNADLSEAVAGKPEVRPPRREKAAKQPAKKTADFRDKHPAPYRATDGHKVRSKAELIIDNWLHSHGILHVYEQRVPVEENCLSDFFLPGLGPGAKGVYIEYWGRESDPKYRERMAVKRAIYAKYRLNLIELGDTEIERLDDILPRVLLQFGSERLR